MSPGLLSPGLSSPGPLSRCGGRAQPHAELPEPPRAAGAPLISRWRQPGKGKGTAEQGVTPKAVTFAFFFPCFVSFWGSSPPHGSTPGASRPQKAQPEPATTGTQSWGGRSRAQNQLSWGGKPLKVPPGGLLAGKQRHAACVRSRLPSCNGSGWGNGGRRLGKRGGAAKLGQPCSPQLLPSRLRGGNF